MDGQITLEKVEKVKFNLKNQQQQNKTSSR